eukprot:CAMPEP_0197455524 /NCGR_PEP_ID=MMETSP1175-20131217/41022_1 /TAXON_ID=1003142 /ORGANISM="Triceratium dubium, Strain CCMP147" /LENGTH=113 /DNA_ID=CAMNT_0042989401 /DNA_START=23 /DNA_END=362 /DNA_ORIENTATION=+
MAPHHSLTESLSSNGHLDKMGSANQQNSNIDDVNGAVIEDIMTQKKFGRATTSPYVKDFLAVLSRGLFAFARVQEERQVKGKNESAPLQLKVFSYEEDIGCLLVSPVESDYVE